MKVKDAIIKDIIKVKRSSFFKAILKPFKNFHIPPLTPVVDGNNCLPGVIHLENLLDVLRSQQTKLLRNVHFIIGENV